MTGVANAVLQYLKTGSGPQSVADLYAYKTGGRNPDGSPERAMLPGYMRDVLGYLHDPLGEIEGKASTGAHLIYELLTNRDFRNLPIGDPNAGFWSAQQRTKIPSFILAYLQHIADAYVPISMKTRMKAGSHLNLPERLLGIRPAPFYIREPQQLERIKESEGRRAWNTKLRADQRIERQKAH